MVIISTLYLTIIFLVTNMLYDIYVMENNKSVCKGTYEADTFNEAFDNMLKDHKEVSPDCHYWATGYEKEINVKIEKGGFFKYE